jgi:(p)ppGpp synthase/HD superfamily hydrolase
MDSKIISFAIEAHQRTNHLYDGNPYSVHLELVVFYAQKYIDKVPAQHRANVLNACWLHDTIEDTRNTYNDIKQISNDTVANIVYAVTNEKGKTRKERANEKYYEGIKREPFAKFVKLCDRLANVKYAVDTNSRMKDVYKKENEHFIHSLFGTDTDQYEDMLAELNTLLL